MSFSQCGELAENLNVLLKFYHELGKVPAVVAFSAVPTGTAVVAAAASTADIGASEIGPPGGDQWCRGVGFRTPAAPAADSAGIGGHTSVMFSRSDSMSLHLDLTPPPRSPPLLAPSPTVDSSSSVIGGNCC